MQPAPSLKFTESIDDTVGVRTIVDQFLETARRRPRATALVGPSRTLTFEEYEHSVSVVATGLRERGVEPGDRVGLLFSNTPEFHVADLAVSALGAIPVSIYNTSSPEQIAYIFGHATISVVLADQSLSERAAQASERVSVLSIDATSPDPWGSIASGPLDLDHAAAKLWNRLPATLIYTSGTTGPPKAVVLTHRNILWTIESFRRVIGDRDLSDARVVSYLPTAHIAERMMSHYQQIAFGFEVTCCPEIAELFAVVRSVHPTIFFGVPRTWEKLAGSLQAALVRLGVDPSNPQGSPEAREAVASVLSFSGLDLVEFATSGAAPIGAPLVQWFRTLGIPLAQVYGLSETTGTISWNPNSPAESVGAPLPGTEVRIAADGEIMTRGGHVFPGYFGETDESQSADPDEWFATGDIGTIDAAGNIVIVDRKKDIIVTAGGKNVSPGNLESAMKEIPLIDQAVAIGDRRPFVSALVTIDRDELRRWAIQEGVHGEEHELLGSDLLLGELKVSIGAAMTRFNGAEQVRAIAIIPDVWLPGTDVLTPTAKVRRRAVIDRYEQEIEDIYGPLGLLP